SEYQYIPCSVMSLMLNRKQQGKLADVEIVAESILRLFNNEIFVFQIISASARRMTILNPLREVTFAYLEVSYYRWILIVLIAPIFIFYFRSFLANINTNLYMTLRPDFEVVALPHSKQPDSTPCGIFCLKFTEKLIKEEELLLPSQPNDIFQYRLDILENCIIRELCRHCGCKMTPGKENIIQWIGCDECGEFWFHYQCMNTNESYKAVYESRIVCVFCEI
ncbi:hypothetical protein ACJMK2_026025, partial [Sinanodonta woodiana]